MEYPKKQIDFEKMFSTEEACKEYLYKIQFPDRYSCAVCDNDQSWSNSRDVIVCKFCRDESIVTAGTIFHKSRLLLTTIFRTLWWIVAQRNGVSAKGLQMILGIGSYEPAWTWLHKFRRIMVISDREKLSVEIEANELLVGAKKSGKRGRGAEGKTLVLMASEVKEYGVARVRLAITPDASRKSINLFTKENITKPSAIITDGRNRYVDYKKMGYAHKISGTTVMSEGE